jgi:hypothetical protein
METCVSRGRAWCIQEFSLYGSRTRPIDIEACAGKVAAQSCEEHTQGLVHACALPGWRALGDPCVAPVQCESGWCSRAPEGQCGVCVEPRVEGDPCNNDVLGLSDCGFGYYCEDSGDECRRLGTFGDPCDDAHECNPAFECLAGACRAPRKEGEGCVPGECLFIQGLICGSSDTCEKVGLAAIGQPCGFTNNPVGLDICAYGGTCAGVPICRPKPADGEACTVNDRGFSECLDLSTCLDGTCAIGFPDCKPPDCHAPCLGPEDCPEHVCVNQICAAPACSDGVKNGSETDVDCGGSACNPCKLTQSDCVAASDCVTGGCIGGKCASVLLLGEVRTRGEGGPGDEFVELYNPGSVSHNLGSSWTLHVRSAESGCGGSGPGDELFAGEDNFVPAHGHLLLAGPGYTQMPAPDAMLIAGPQGALADAGSITLLHGTTVIDTVCYSFDATSAMTLTSCVEPYSCAGAPVNNAPHDGGASASGNVNQSFERKPGGAKGNAQSTGDNQEDFLTSAPANPESSDSPPAPLP